VLWLLKRFRNLLVCLLLKKTARRGSKEDPNPTVSFADRIRARIKQGKPKTIQESLVSGMYIIMRKMNGYTHFDFLNDEFMGAHFFLLIDLIQEEVDIEQREREKQSKKK
jgi:tRNA isopentenyl-2-thiomethyl-A-37 hydroxylase MiaE